MSSSNFIVRGGADFSAIHREVATVQTRLGGLQSFFSRGLKFTGIALGVRELIKFGKEAIGVASDLEEVQNVVDVTFGHMASDVNEFASMATKQFGLSELSAKKFSSTMGAMLKSSGISGEAVKNMSIEMTKLTADMASFYNLDGEEAFTKIRSGLSGQTEPLKQLGINMSVANMQAFALSQGIKKSWQEMNQAEQTMLRYNYLLNVTGDAQGDFARNSGSWANQIKLLKEQWQEFMSLIGKALIEILLPVVQFLNKALEVLINITKEIGKLYTMITGKEVTVTAQTAAEAENDLADGIKKATKAAKKALAPFDELNILQNKLGSGDGLTGIIPESKGETNTSISTKSIDNGFDDTKNKLEKFFIWFGDKWNGLKQTLSIPVLVPAPIFASIPSPIYNPDWGLNPPIIPPLVFPPITNPVYIPNWNLVPPQIPVPVFPAIDYSAYNISLETIKSKAAETRTALEKTHSELVKKLEEETVKVSKRIENGLSTTWGTIETNYNKHKVNVGAIALGISTVLVANINQGLSKLGINTNNALTTTQNNWQTWGKNLGGIAIESAKSFSTNFAEGLKVTAQNTVSFANTHLNNMKTWGSGVLSVAGETAKGFVSNMASGFRSTWDNFKSLMSGMGEKVSGWFSENKSMVIKTAITAGVVVGAGALALAAPAAIPYIATALGGLSSIPALAKGGITNGPMLAMIGDNPGGKEVVSPLDGLLGMITDVVRTENNSNGGDTTIIVKVGEDTILDKVISGVNRQNRINGKTVITV